MDKKVQTTIPEESELQLNRIINAISMQRGVLLNQPQYIRELILNNIKEYYGEQMSYVNETAKKILEDFYKNKENN